MIKMNFGDSLSVVRFPLIIFLFSVLLICCNTEENKSNNELVLNFVDREIDIEPYFEDFPFSRFSLSKDGTKLLFMENGVETKLKMLDVNANSSVMEAEDVTPIDFSKRNIWSPEYNPFDHAVYWVGDENNEEIMNIYRAKEGVREIEKITDLSYVYSWAFNDEGSKIAYIARLEPSEDSQSELRILDLETMEDNLIVADSDTYSFTWGDIAWNSEEDAITTKVVKNRDRTFTNIVYIPFDQPDFKIISDENKTSTISGTEVLSKWISEDTYLFLSDANGFSNLYKYSFKENKLERLTDERMGIDQASIVTINDTKYVFTLQKNPISSLVSLRDAFTGKTIWDQQLDADLSMETVVGNQVFFIAEDTTTPFELIKGKVTEKGISLTTLLDVPEGIKKKIVHSEVERLEIPTFDIDSATGEKRMLHAYLFKPDKPLQGKDKTVMIESFYGGMNAYSMDYQVLTQAGIYVLSPAPRGSSGFGRDFEAMNDGDLGGNEIIDIIYAAKFITEKLDIPSDHVGVFGMSHGGYATMRLLTFPGEVNGHKADFPFGFGIEIAGFADIILQHNTSNIPGWTLLEAGDPQKDSLKLMDRSPISHAEKITGPLLLVHGDHDNRVNIEGSRIMAKKLEELNKPFKLVELPGLGHGIKGLENYKKFYEESFRFIEDEVLAPNREAD